MNETNVYDYFDPLDEVHVCGVCKYLDRPTGRRCSLNGRTVDPYDLVKDEEGKTCENFLEKEPLPFPERLSGKEGTASTLRITPYISSTRRFITFVEEYDSSVWDVKENYFFAYSIYEKEERSGIYLLHKRVMTSTRQEAEVRAQFEPSEQAYPLSAPDDLVIVGMQIRILQEDAFARFITRAIFAY